MEYGLVILWLFMYLLVGLLSYPIAATLLPSLPRQGVGLVFGVFFAIFGITGYWIGQVMFGWVTAVLVSVILLASTGLAIYIHEIPNLRDFWDVALVFTLAFGLLVTIRALDPGAYPGGGEKFLDFGLLASLLRANYLPPEDMWFAGKRVKYYYGGHMLAALFAELTQTKARFAYNLALSGFYASYVATAYGLAGEIAAANGRSYYVSGGIAAIFVGIASNLAPPLRLIIWALPATLNQIFASITGLRIIGLALGPRQFNYWFASRVITGTINEFPFFAFLNGDMHAHMMSPPLLLLGAAILLGYYTLDKDSVLLRRLYLFVGIPLIAGLLAIVNTWAFPTIFGLVFLTLLFTETAPWRVLPQSIAMIINRYKEPGPREEALRILIAGILTLIAVILAVMSALPFFTETATKQGIGFLPDRSSIQGLLVVHGVFLSITALYFRQRFTLSRGDLLLLSFAVSIALVMTWQVTATALILFLPLLAIGWYLLRTTDEVGYETILAVGVLGLLLLVEFVYVKERAGPGRMNTVFKIYAQIWALWSVACGVMLEDISELSRALADAARALVETITQISPRVRASNWFQKSISNFRGQEIYNSSPGFFRPRNVKAILAIGLLLSLSIYTGFGVGEQFIVGREKPTLDALQFVYEQHPGEAPAIEWLNNLSGQPNMVSAPGISIYQWVNGPASLTGIPTVAGWAHEIGYRSSDAYFDRVQDVRHIFNGRPGLRASLLRKYNVQYIYVGPIERKRYGTVEFADEPGISIAFQNDVVTIYAVNQSALQT
ncbi:MAG: DUF2298 domain-containing protein [Halobacteriaceae archaeon]